MFDDPRKKLHWMEEELKREEPDAGFVSGEDLPHAVYTDDRPMEDRAVVVPKKRKGGWGLLILLMLALAATARWWMQWL